MREWFSVTITSPNLPTLRGGFLVSKNRTLPSPNFSAGVFLKIFASMKKKRYSIFKMYSASLFERLWMSKSCSPQTICLQTNDINCYSSNSCTIILTKKSQLQQYQKKLLEMFIYFEYGHEKR